MEKLTNKLLILLKKKWNYNEDSINFFDKLMEDTFAAQLKIAIAYHFLADRQTNRIDKPEWLFSFIQNILENNLKALMEIGVESSIF